MANLNKVMLMGNMTRAIDIRSTSGGKSVGQFGLAINRVWTTDSGEKREDVTFVDIEVWGKQAEVIDKYTTKGSSLYVEGRLKLETWDDKQSGQKRSKMKVILESFQFIGSKREDDGGRQEKPRRPAQRPETAPDPDLDPPQDDPDNL